VCVSFYFHLLCSIMLNGLLSQNRFIASFGLNPKWFHRFLNHNSSYILKAIPLYCVFTPPGYEIPTDKGEISWIRSSLISWVCPISIIYPSIFEWPCFVINTILLGALFNISRYVLQHLYEAFVDHAWSDSLYI